jgi:two-component system nitrate/nitrite response regulator NarL
MIIKIAILDDHQIVIDGLKLLLKDQPNLKVIAENTNGLVLLKELSSTKVDILITDVVMPIIDGYEMAMRVKSDFPAIKVIALSMNGDGPLIDKMIEEADVKAYLLKTTNKAELIEAIHAVVDNDTYFSKEIIEELHAYSKIKRANQVINLTSREIEIIECIAKDLSNKQIAEHLYISERTVETHRKNIFRKTDLHSVLGLIDYAKKKKII